MKLVVAMDSFKGCMTAMEASCAFERGFKKGFENVEVIKLPMADGGEGTVQSLVDATKGHIIKEWVTGPLGEPVEAFYGLLGDGKTAVIEMAAASGLPLVPIEKRNPLITTTFGTGELIRKALDRGCREFYIGIGGSATNDGGAGMAQALGISLVDSTGKELPYGGGALKELANIDMTKVDERILESSIIVACDVDNPLCGERGAANVYGPQKGATSDMVKVLDEALLHFSNIVKRDLDKEILQVKGAGAAGGLGGGLIAFLGAKLMPGIEMVIEKSQLAEVMKGAALVVTGEGQIDQQTVYGKTPIGVARVAKSLNIPVVAIAGTRGKNAEAVRQHGIDCIFSLINRPITLEEAMEKDNAVDMLEKLAEEIAGLIRLSGKML